MKAIVCVDKENHIGYKNEVLFNFRRDKLFFKNTTMGNIVVMGRNTYDSIGKPLPGRKNYVLTHRRDLEFKDEQNKAYHDIDLLISDIKDRDDVFIIGGEYLYNEFLDYFDTVYLTQVHTVAKKYDASFPTLKGKWNYELIEHGYNSDDGIAYSIYKLTRIDLIFRIKKALNILYRK